MYHYPPTYILLRMYTPTYLYLRMYITTYVYVYTSLFQNVCILTKCIQSTQNVCYPPRWIGQITSENPNQTIEILNMPDTLYKKEEEKQQQQRFGKGSTYIMHIPTYVYVYIPKRIHPHKLYTIHTKRILF